MKAVIWAGGFGTRLLPLTKNKQKCMIDIAGKPCLERVIEHIENFGIDQIIVKVHYKYEQIVNYFGSRVLYYYQKELKDEEESIKEMSKWLFDDFTFVVNGDTLTDLDINKMFFYTRRGNVKFMDDKDLDKYAGSMILSPYYWQGKDKFIKYYNTKTQWWDIGTFSGLKKAQQYFERKKN